jgi:uncharacterized secreted protein with C-terminal beta-propeller domain
MAPEEGTAAVDGGAEALTSEVPAPTANMAVQETAEADTAASSSSAGADAGYSETNTQVECIDEADIVKTDGSHIYALTQNELAVFKAGGPDTTEVARIQLIEDSDYAAGSYPQEMYLAGSVLAVVVDYYHYQLFDGSVLEGSSSESAALEEPTSDDSSSSSSSSSSSRPAAYESVSETRLLLYDISNPAAPARITEFAQSGNYRSSRVYDGTLYLISSYYLPGVPSSDDPGSFVPLLGQGAARGYMEIDDIRTMPEVQQASYTVVTSYDIATQVRVDQKSVLGEASTTYMSYNNLYLASSVYESEAKEPYQESVYTVEERVDKYSTQIIRVGIGAGALDVAAQCVIDGILLNQFSLDEYEGNLRLALTVSNTSYRILRDESHDVETYQYDDTVPTNAVYVLSPSLTALGSIEGLAADERIYSVRFTGPVGYMVTFRQMDPLFALDLSDPTSPKVTSELKIPGFSTYLHPFGEGRLLGLGYNATEFSTEGMKLSMFNTSDPFDVSELDAESVDTSDSEALYNHKAVLVDVERNIIGFSGYDWETGEMWYFVYRYDDAGGFELRGMLSLGSVYGYNARGLFIGEYLYVLTSGSLDVFDLESLEGVASLVVSTPDTSGGYGVMPMTGLAIIE